jgi:hypothetical protein
VPNNLIPWSESSFQPFIIECLFKLILALICVFRQNNSVVLTLNAIAMGLISLKIWFRIKKSIMWNNIVFKISILLDTILFHYVAHMLLKDLFMGHYIVYVSLLLPFTLFASWYVMTTYKKGWIIDNATRLFS